MTIGIIVAMDKELDQLRLLLDNASTVEEAIALLEQYNMRMYNTDNKHNYHYLMDDAKGNYAIVE